MYWIETTTDEEAERVEDAVWGDIYTVTENGFSSHVNGNLIDGEFWTEALERVKHDPHKRIEVASAALPVPAAWSEIAIGTRALIRAARKTGADYESELRALHNLAAIQSFAAHDPRYYDFIALIPFSRLASLDLDPLVIGWEKLQLLNQTDRKWMLDLWGEPSQHTTAQILHRDLFGSEVKRIGALKVRREKARIARLEAIMERDSAFPLLDPLPKREERFTTGEESNPIPATSEDHPSVPDNIAPKPKPGILARFRKALFG